MTIHTVAELIREGRPEAAVARMQDLCRIADPESPVDPVVVAAQYVEMRERLRAVVPPAPFKVVVEVLR